MLIPLFVGSGRRRWLLGAGMLLLLSLVAFLADSDRGSVYGNRSELLKAQKNQGYVLVGSFGRLDWPAIVVGGDRGQGGVDFVTADGQPHQYRGFSGPMKALHLRAGLIGSKRFTLVFHQIGKTSPDTSPFKDIR